MAPSNGETVMFLVPVAPGLDDNNKIRNTFAQTIIEHFEKLTDSSIKPFIKVKKYFHIEISYQNIMLIWEHR